MVEFNNYIDDLNIDALIKFMNGENDDFEPIPIPKEVDDEIRKIITEQYSRTKSILLDNREKLEEVTKILLEKETIMGPEFEAIMADKNI